MLKTCNAGVLEVSYDEMGNANGWPVILLHGFPYDMRAFDAVTPILVEKGARVLTPALRGFGLTRFRSATTPRSGEQAALGKDLLDLLDALNIPSAILAGYDWGGRAACVVSALWPERVDGLVSQNGYNIQDLATAGIPLAPENEWRLWYQYYFHSERGRLGLKDNRRELCKLLWRLWSPNWAFEDACFDQTASSFDNDDFVDVVIHSYRHRYGHEAGDPELANVEAKLAQQPAITVPTISLDGATDGVLSPSGERSKSKFSQLLDHRVIDGAGHNLPQERPAEFAEAVLDVRAFKSTLPPYSDVSRI